MKFKKFVLPGSAFLLLSLCAVGETLIYGGTIRTMDATHPVVEALVFENGKIIALGDKTLLEKNYSSADRVDLLGHTLLPGFIDSHVHVRELGMDAVKANLVGVQSVKEMVSRLQAKFPRPIAGEWLVGQGWDEGEFASVGYPDRAVLDAAFPDNPVHLESLHGFGGFYNAAALKIAGITASTPDPEVGQILRRENMAPTGVMLTLAQNLVNKHVPEPSPGQREAAIVAGLSIMARAGVTSIHEAGMTSTDVAAFINLRKRDALPIRVYGMLNGNDAALMQQWFDRGPLRDKDKLLEIKGVKVFYDGSLGSRTALLKAPYSDHPEKANPTERISPALVASLAQQSAKHGFQMAVHAIGDEGNNRTLGIYEKSLAPFKSVDARWRIEHAQVVLPDFFERAAKIGLVASMQPSHAVGDSGWAEDRLGSQRILYAYAWQKMLSAKVALALNSDLPGEPWTPVQTLYFAVTRAKLDNTAADAWYKKEALSVQQALTAMTITNAFAGFQETYIGSLEVGKFADFVVLDRDPLSIDTSELKDLKVLQTWLAGSQIHSSQ